MFVLELLIVHLFQRAHRCACVYSVRGSRDRDVNMPSSRRGIFIRLSATKQSVMMSVMMSVTLHGSSVRTAERLDLYLP